VSATDYNRFPSPRPRATAQPGCREEPARRVLLDSQAFAEVVEIVRAEEFLPRRAPQGVRGMSALFGKGQPIDRITSGRAHRPGRFDAVGGDEFIDLLDKIVPTAANLAYYAKIIHEKCWRAG